MNAELKSAVRGLREAIGEMERRIANNQPVARSNAVTAATTLREIGKLQLEAQRLVGRVPVHRESAQ